MATILDEIVKRKEADIASKEKEIPLSFLQEEAFKAGDARGFVRNLLKTAQIHPAIIAEVKRGSPSLGYIRPDLDPVVITSQYEKGGASAISCLTDEPYFYAHPDDFARVRASIKLPMLRKDFMVCPYQIFESKAMGADCILLIMSCLTDQKAAELADLAHDLGMDVFAEAHNAEEIQRIEDHVNYDLLGINNRNLKNFSTNVEHCIQLADRVSKRDRLVAESGLHDAAVIKRLFEANIRMFLIGEAFVTSDDPQQKVNEFYNA
ncbi:MAG: indole-3-glycerol phosphate synthase TrpC [Lentisphaeria bacterium]|nr:indole-3-glycerol phosphate synthase TrpC [Lentisphaeria bacterium]